MFDKEFNINFSVSFSLISLYGIFYIVSNSNLNVINPKISLCWVVVDSSVFVFGIKVLFDGICNSQEVVECSAVFGVLVEVVLEVFE